LVFVALGANLPSRFGGPPETLAAAREALERQNMRVIKASRLWLTAPVPISDQAWYHNQVVSIQTSLSPPECLQKLHAIEQSFGRVRQARNEARILDLDIVAWGNEIINENGLVIPHPRMTERLFVLGPLSDIAPDWIHPTSGKNVKALLAALPGGQKAEVVNG
jgi:2-amino-4-hydroxy-6-hydroxymethyldihydropteridine diphosphokinase